jgi:hypothetical protein
MLVYNLLSEIIADQFIIIAFSKLLLLVLFFLFLKKRLTLKTCLIAILFALILSLMSTIIARGYYGGTLYHEKFGWPIQYY